MQVREDHVRLQAKQFADYRRGIQTMKKMTQFDIPISIQAVGTR
jgi:hypothetical protein